MPLISVIMPVYNSDKYLKTAIESILNQSFTSFELILVDDGSTDASGVICDEYSNIDERVKVIHQKNSGISCARNVGLNNSTGDYIAFADNDDFFHEDLLEDNYKFAKENDADIVKFGVSYIIEENKKSSEIEIRTLQSSKLNKKDMREKYLELKNNNIFVYVWDSLIKSDLIKKNNIYFNENFKLGGEDINFNLTLFAYARSLYINEKKYYTHFKRMSHSTTVKFNKLKLESFLINAEAEHSLLTQILSNNDLINIWPEIMSIHIWQILVALTNLKDMKKKDKIRYMRMLSEKEIFNTDFSWKTLKLTFNRNKKRAIVLFLYKLKRLKCLYWLADNVRK